MQSSGIDVREKRGSVEKTPAFGRERSVGLVRVGSGDSNQLYEVH